ncbi:MAG: primary-amine oxidase [Armatimonadetes bacterium]|nr:primary-amine oxidase [Armatimonadota bacterium]
MNITPVAAHVPNARTPFRIASPYQVEDHVTVSAAAPAPLEDVCEAPPAESLGRRAAKAGMFAAMAVSGLMGMVGCSRTPPPAPDSISQTVSQPHFLDPLSSGEITRVAETVRGYEGYPADGVFSTLTLREPGKDEVPGREAVVVVHDQAAGKTYEGIVDVRAGQVTSWKEVPGAQPAVGSKDYGIAEDLIAKDPRWQEALRKRGITDASKVYVDTWAQGPSSDPSLAGHRLVKTLAFYKGDTIYPYARPIEGMLGTVDVTAGRVVEVVDRGIRPISQVVGGYDENSVGPLRQAPKPLVTSFPEGASFEVNGQHVKWQNWDFHFSLAPREGPVLHKVGYEDRGVRRSVLERMSLSEMAVPYGDPDPNWQWRSAFDVGEYGFGRRASPLQPGVDVPAHARFFDATFADNEGKPYTIPRAIAVYERDGGVIWKHYDNNMSTGESRRGRDLVVAFSTAVGNYDYMLNYVFKQDGSMEVKADLNGLMLAKGEDAHVAHHGGLHHGHLVDQGVSATHHQHFFNFRIDMDVDGRENSLLEMNTSSIPLGPDNPTGNAFRMDETTLKTEQEAQRKMNMGSARKWIVVNPNQTNRLGMPTGYALLPGENTVPFAAPENMARRRAGFVENHLWGTAYKPTEMYAAGDYPNQSAGGDGLPRYAADNESLENKDLVVWYTMGCTHIPRPEEWPIMPTAQVGFKLVPVGFFDRNPALDLPGKTAVTKNVEMPRGK